MDNKLISEIYYKCREYMIIQRVLDSFKEKWNERCINIRMEPYCDMLRVNINGENGILFFERYEGSREDIKNNRGGYIVTIPYLENGHWQKNILEIESYNGEVKLNVRDRKGVKQNYNSEELENKVKENSKRISELLTQKMIDFLIALNNRFSEEIGDIDVSYTDGLRELLIRCLNVDLKNHFATENVMNCLDITDTLEEFDTTGVSEKDIEAYKRVIDYIQRCIKASRDAIKIRVAEDNGDRE